MAIFPTFFFLDNIAQGNVFDDILERKNVFLGYKNKMFKKSKKWIFSKGVNPWLNPKMAIIPPFLFTQYRPGKCLWRYSIEKNNAFLGYKNNKFKTLQNWHFSKEGNPWIWTKNGHFSNFFFFRQYRTGKCIWRYSRAKKRLSRP